VQIKLYFDNLKAVFQIVLLMPIFFRSFGRSSGRTQSEKENIVLSLGRGIPSSGFATSFCWQYEGNIQEE
jgi:hypothetical protein